MSRKSQVACRKQDREADAGRDSRLTTRDSRLSVTMIAPEREECGVADYTRHLLPELQRRVEVRHVTDAPGFTIGMNDVDLAHIQHEYFLFGGVAPWRCRFRALAARLRVPAVVTAHEFVTPQGSLARRAAIALSNRLHFRHPAVRRLLVHTDADRDRMTAAGFSPDRIVVVRHGVPPAPALPSRLEARRALGLEEGRFVLTVFGFLSRRKGHRLAIEAMTSLPEEAMLLFAGGQHPDDRTTYVEELNEMIQQTGLASRVHITGYLTAKAAAAAMSATDLVLAPFTESSGSGSLAFAFASGRPILASDIAPHREIMRETPGALALFPCGNPGALSAAVQPLMEDRSALEALAEGAQRYAAAHSYMRMAEETVTVYRQVLAEVQGCASA